MARLRIALVLVALGVLGAAEMWLARVESELPFPQWLELPGGVPARLYLPEPPGPAGLPPPLEERPPAIVLVHGHSGDQVGLSGLAYALRDAGFAVLTLDLRGHGHNRNPFERGYGRSDRFVPELRAAVDHLRLDPRVDGSRIALAGHSMGAGAALSYATRDTGIDATLLISGGWELPGPYRPPNVLLLHAERELSGIVEAEDAVAARLVGARAEADRTYGDLAAATAVRVHRVPGTDHRTIVRSEETLREITGWLDAVWGLHRDRPVRFEDVRLLPAQVALAAFAVVLVGLGGAMGRLARGFEGPLPVGVAAEGQGGHARNLVPLALVLVALLPFFSLYAMGFLANLNEGDRQVTWLSCAGLLLLAGLALSGGLTGERLRVPGRPASWGGSVGVALAAFLLAYVLFTPWAVVLRGLDLTPERWLLSLWIALALSPFALAFHVLLTGDGPWWRRLLLRIAGRAAILAALWLGLALEVFWFPGRLMVGVLLVNFLFLELVFAGYTAASRNPITAAAFEALWLGWMTAVTMPSSL